MSAVALCRQARSVEFVADEPATERSTLASNFLDDVVANCKKLKPSDKIAIAFRIMELSVRDGIDLAIRMGLDSSTIVKGLSRYSVQRNHGNFALAFRAALEDISTVIRPLPNELEKARKIISLLPNPITGESVIPPDKPLATSRRAREILSEIDRYYIDYLKNREGWTSNPAYECKLPRSDGHLRNDLILKAQALAAELDAVLNRREVSRYHLEETAWGKLTGTKALFLAIEARWNTIVKSPGVLSSRYAPNFDGYYKNLRHPEYSDWCPMLLEERREILNHLIVQSGGRLSQVSYSLSQARNIFAALGVDIKETELITLTDKSNKNSSPFISQSLSLMCIALTKELLNGIDRRGYAGAQVLVDHDGPQIVTRDGKVFVPHTAATPLPFDRLREISIELKNVVGIKYSPKLFVAVCGTTRAGYRVVVHNGNELFYGPLHPGFAKGKNTKDYISGSIVLAGQNLGYSVPEPDGSRTAYLYKNSEFKQVTKHVRGEWCVRNHELFFVSIHRDGCFIFKDRGGSFSSSIIPGSEAWFNNGNEANAVVLNEYNTNTEGRTFFWISVVLDEQCYLVEYDGLSAKVMLCALDADEVHFIESEPAIVADIAIDSSSRGLGESSQKHVIFSRSGRRFDLVAPSANGFRAKKLGPLTSFSFAGEFSDATAYIDGERLHSRVGSMGQFALRYANNFAWTVTVWAQYQQRYIGRPFNSLIYAVCMNGAKEYRSATYNNLIGPYYIEDKPHFIGESNDGWTLIAFNRGNERFETVQILAGSGTRFEVSSREDGSIVWLKTEGNISTLSSFDGEIVKELATFERLVTFERHNGITYIRDSLLPKPFTIMNGWGKVCASLTLRGAIGVLIDDPYRFSKDGFSAIRYSKSAITWTTGVDEIPRLEESEGALLELITVLSSGDSELIGKYARNNPTRQSSVSAAHAQIFSDILHDVPDLFLNDIGAIKDNFSTKGALQLLCALYPDVRQRLEEVRAQNSSAQVNNHIYPEDVLEPRDTSRVGGGDPEALFKEKILSTKRPVDGFLLLNGYEKCLNGRDWQAADLPYETITSSDAELVRVLLPVKSRSYQNTIPHGADRTVYNLRTNSGDTLAADTSLSHAITAQVTPGVYYLTYETVVSYGDLEYLDLEVSEIDFFDFKKGLVDRNGKEIACELGRLPPEARLFLDSIRNERPLNRALMIQEWVRESMFYDSKNAAVREEKKDLNLTENISFMRSRLLELRTNGVIPEREKGKIFAGVCSDAGKLAAGMLRASGFPTGVAEVVCMRDQTIANTGDLHALAFIPWPTKKGGLGRLWIDSVPGGADLFSGMDLSRLINTSGDLATQGISSDKRKASENRSEINLSIQTDNSQGLGGERSIPKVFDRTTDQLFIVLFQHPEVFSALESSENPEQWRESLKEWYWPHLNRDLLNVGNVNDAVDYHFSLATKLLPEKNALDIVVIMRAAIDEVVHEQSKLTDDQRTILELARLRLDVIMDAVV